MEIQRYWAVMGKWLRLIVVGTLVAGGTSYFLSRGMDPVYEATATLVVHETTSAIPGYEYNRATVATHAVLITKQSVIEAVGNELGLPYSVKELLGKVSARTNPNTPLIELSARDNDPIIAQQIANTTVEAYIRQHNEKLRADAQASLSLIQSQIEEITKRTYDLQAKRNDLEQLKNLRTLWNFQLAQAMAAASISLGEPASLPTVPVSPKTAQNVLLASILGLVVTTGAVFLKEYLDRSVKTADDISKLTGLAILGIVPKFNPTRKENGRPIIEARPQGSVAEAFRMLHNNLQFAIMEKPAKTIVVISPNPKEGKTSIVANLAVSIAQMGNTVIAVDTDLRNRQLDQLFKVPNGRGFTDLLLAAQPDVDGFLQPTTVEGLRVLTRGSHTDNPAQLLGSLRTSLLIEALRKEADIILFDSSPILAVADVTLLAPKVDGAILVVAAGRTRPEELVDAKEALSKGNVNILGVVLNGVDVSRRSSYYYYRYRHSSYAHHGEDGEKKRDKPQHAAGS